MRYVPLRRRSDHFRYRGSEHLPAWGSPTGSTSGCPTRHPRHVIRPSLAHLRLGCPPERPKGSRRASAADRQTPTEEARWIAAEADLYADEMAGHGRQLSGQQRIVLDRRRLRSVRSGPPKVRRRIPTATRGRTAGGAASRWAGHWCRSLTSGHPCGRPTPCDRRPMVTTTRADGSVSTWHPARGAHCWIMRRGD